MESEDYLDRKKKLLTHLLDPTLLSQTVSTPSQKHLFLIKFKHLHEIDHQTLQGHFSLIQEQDQKMDFFLIILIRFLFLSSSNDVRASSSSSSSERTIAETETEKRSCLQQLHQLLSKFIFWPSSTPIPSSPFSEAMKDHCFWSENHIFMYLSSALLYHEHCMDHFLPCLVTNREISLLKIYLTVHALYPSTSPSDGGMYETLSHVYLPYTLASLLNLFDFSRDPEIRNLASIVIQKIVNQLLLCTNCDGISTFTPSTRQFNKTQTRSWGHNVNQLIYLLTGIAHDKIKPTPILDFLLTSNWYPSETLSKTFESTGYLRQVMIHSIEEIRELYLQYLPPDLTPLELVPFYWSVRFRRIV